MIEAVFKDSILFAYQCLNNAKIGHVAGRKKQRPRLATKIRQLFFERMMKAAVTTNSMGGATANTELVSRTFERSNNFRMISQAKIVIAAEIKQPSAIDLCFSANRRLLLKALAIAMLSTTLIQRRTQVKRMRHVVTCSSALALA